MLTKTFAQLSQNIKAIFQIFGLSPALQLRLTDNYRLIMSQDVKELETTKPKVN